MQLERNSGNKSRRERASNSDEYLKLFLAIGVQERNMYTITPHQIIKRPFNDFSIAEFYKVINKQFNTPDSVPVLLGSSLCQIEG